MLLPNTDSFLLTRRRNVGSDFLTPIEETTVAASETQSAVTESPLLMGTFVDYRRMLLPNKQSFLLTRKKTITRDVSTTTEVTTVVIPDEFPTDAPLIRPREVSFGYRRMVLPNKQSFLLARKQTVSRNISTTTEITTVVVPDELPAGGVSPEGPVETAIGDVDRRKFIKIAGIAGAGLIASQLMPNKAEALILGSSPTTGVVGVKNAANVRINPATEETLATVLKTSDLTFDAGSLEVKVTSMPTGSSSFSDSGNVARSGLVDSDRHVQVDVLSSALPSSASTETTLQTISFGGFKFTLRLATVGDVDYIGEASIGTATSAASWRIKRVDSTTGTVIQWAGTGVFNQVWDNRASLSYS